MREYLFSVSWYWLSVLPKLICCFTPFWTYRPAKPLLVCEWQRGGAPCTPGPAAPGIPSGGADPEVCSPFLHAGITLSYLRWRRNKCSVCFFSGLSQNHLSSWVSVFLPWKKEEFFFSFFCFLCFFCFLAGLGSSWMRTKIWRLFWRRLWEREGII